MHNGIQEFGYVKRREKAELEGKGALNAEITTILYRYLENNGIETHYIKTLDATGCW